jgi:hypothetical protein
MRHGVEHRGEGKRTAVRATTTVQIGTADTRFLAGYGARSQRGGGEFSRSLVLHRLLDGLRCILERSDPRSTHGLSREGCEVLVRTLRHPWRLSPFEIDHIHDPGLHGPELEPGLAEAGVEPKRFLAEVAALPFAGKAFLADAAASLQAPAASAALYDE